MTPQFATSDVYNPTALASHSHTHEMLQQSDATAQQSQPAPTVQLANATRATERWDGKSMLLKFLEPLIDGVRTFVNPIANVFMDAMPATFRGLTSYVTATKSKNFDEDLTPAASTEEKAIQPKQILIPQPRYIAQRKSAEIRKRDQNKPKKYTEMKINLENMKNNKDYIDYVKNKKYKYNYPYTHYYPRVKYFVNPNTFLEKSQASHKLINVTSNNHSRYKRPITLFSNDIISNNKTIKNKYILNNTDFHESNDWIPIISPEFSTHTRSKRNVRTTEIYSQKPIQAINYGNKQQNQGRGFFDFLFNEDPWGEIIDKASKYTKSIIKSNIKPQLNSGPPKYYLITYDIVMFSLQVLDDFVQMKQAMYQHLFGHKAKRTKPIKNKNKTKKKKTIKQKKGHHHHHQNIANIPQNMNNDDDNSLLLWRNNTKI